MSLSFHTRPIAWDIVQSSRYIRFRVDNKTTTITNPIWPYFKLPMTNALKDVVQQEPASKVSLIRLGRQLYENARLWDWVK